MKLLYGDHHINPESKLKGKCVWAYVVEPCLVDFWKCCINPKESNLFCVYSSSTQCFQCFQFILLAFYDDGVRVIQLFIDVKFHTINQLENVWMLKANSGGVLFMFQGVSTSMLGVSNPSSLALWGPTSWIPHSLWCDKNRYSGIWLFSSSIMW